MKNCAIQYRIDGKDWFDPDLFLINAKQSITNRVINRRLTKVKLILSCMMEKVDLKGGEMIANRQHFTLKQKSKFQRQQSNGRFRSVLSLALHTVKYEPLGGSPYIPLSDFLSARKAIINLKN